MSWYRSLKRPFRDVSNFVKKTRLDRVALGAATQYATGGASGAGMYTSGAGMYTSGIGGYNGPSTEGNDIFNGGSGMNVAPQFDGANAADLGGMMFTHREYIGDVYANSANSSFTVQSYPINPGLQSLFPLASQMAINFEEYELLQLAVTFQSTCSENQTTAGLGTVVIATLYDPNDPDFTSKKTMLGYAGASSVVITNNLVHGIECDDNQNAGDSQKYTRNGPVLNASLKDYDYGKINVAICGTASSIADQTIGELWISYTLILRKPKLYSSLGNTIRRERWIAVPGGRTKPINGGVDNIGATLVQAWLPQTGVVTSGGFVGNGPYIYQDTSSNIGISYSAVNVTSSTFTPQFTLPANLSGTYCMEIVVQLSTTTGAADLSYQGIWTPTYAGNIQPLLYQMAAPISTGAASTATTMVMYSQDPEVAQRTTESNQNPVRFYFTVGQAVNGVPNTIQFTNNIAASTASGCTSWNCLQLVFTQVNASILTVPFSPNSVTSGSWVAI